jgi:choline dehydrogenase
MGRGRGLGGCSIHNAMIYVRGGYKGFDNWAAQGNTGWDYQSVLPYFQQVEETLSITTAQSDPFIDSLIAACENEQIPYNPNYNQNTDLVCVSPFQFAISGGKRETTYSAFLTSPPSNLTVWSGYLIEQIIIDGSKTARGAVISSVTSRAQTEISANIEVILSAGAIGSPHILMLSGVGPESELSNAGITTIQNLQGVGQNFQDDLYVTAWFKSPQPMPAQPYGLMGAVIFASSPFNDPTQGTDIECSLAAGTLAGLNLPPDEQQSWFIYPNIQLMKSRGTVTLKSSNPQDAPVIDPNYLSADDDIYKCAAAVEMAVCWGSDPALSNWVESVLLPNTDDVETYVRNTAGTCYHYAGTCKMGPNTDPMAVVAPDLTVYGISNLRVIDSSIIPTTVSGNTAAATMMIAQKGSTEISKSNK